MRILWITNIIFPKISEKIGLPKPVVGGWMYSLAENLKVNKNIHLAVATVYDGDDIVNQIIDNIEYYLLPKGILGNDGFSNPELEKNWRIVKENFSPDIVHIHGTEFPFGLSYFKECGSTNCVVSIQGMTSVYKNYFFGGISRIELLKYTTLFEVLSRTSLFNMYKAMKNRGVFELEYIRKTQNVIGRTSWDKFNCLEINENINYHFCNENLRSVFYKNLWKYENCEKHSIFLSQGIIPLKGIHQVIKALPSVLKDFPDSKIYISGPNIISSQTFKQKLVRSAYGNYIANLIKKLKLTDHVIFVGLLNEEEILKKYLETNVFICPSSIENSPNSLGEAQILGVPTISSYVGGIPDMVENGINGYLYRFEEISMLSSYIKKIFRDGDNLELSNNSRKIAAERHNTQVNTEKLLEIYNRII